MYAHFSVHQHSASLFSRPDGSGAENHGFPFSGLTKLYLWVIFFSILHHDFMLVKDQWTVSLLKQKKWGNLRSTSCSLLVVCFQGNFELTLCSTAVRFCTWEASQRMKRMKAQLHQWERSTPCITTSSKRKERWVQVVGDFLSKESREPNKPTHGSVCCLPGTWVTDLTKTLPSLEQPSEYPKTDFLHRGQYSGNM